MTYYSPAASGSSFPRTPRTVIIPMAAGPHRYDEAIFHPLAPLTLAAGHPVLEWTLESLGLDGRIVFVVRREHYDRYNLEYLLGLMAPRLDIVVLESVDRKSVV